MKKNFIFINNTIDSIRSIPDFLKDGLAISIILHIFLLILIVISPHVSTTALIPKIKYDEPIIVDLESFTIGQKTILPPLPNEIKKNESKEYFKPEINQKQESQPIHTPPTSKNDDSSTIIEEKKPEQPMPQTTKSNTISEEEVLPPSPIKKNLKEERIGDLDDLLSSVDGLTRNDKNTKDKEIEKLNTTPEFTEIKKGIEASSIDTKTNSYQQNSTADYLKNQLAISYIDAIRIKLKSCWNIDPGAKNIKNMKITIRTTMSPDGNINNIDILDKDQYNTSPWFKAVADGAKRALIICAPYNLPVEFYNDWKNIVFTFYPDKKSIQ